MKPSSLCEYCTALCCVLLPLLLHAAYLPRPISPASHGWLRCSNRCKANDSVPWPPSLDIRPSFPHALARLRVISSRRQSLLRPPWRMCLSMDLHLRLKTGHRSSSTIIKFAATTGRLTPPQSPRQHNQALSYTSYIQAATAPTHHHKPVARPAPTPHLVPLGETARLAVSSVDIRLCRPSRPSCGSQGRRMLCRRCLRQCAARCVFCTQDRLRIYFGV